MYTDAASLLPDDLEVGLLPIGHSEVVSVQIGHQMEASVLIGCQKEASVLNVHQVEASVQIGHQLGEACPQICHCGDFSYALRDFFYE